MKQTLRIMALCMAVALCGCKDSANADTDDPDKGKGDTPKITASALAEQNLLRAMQLADSAAKYCFEGATMKLYRYYNPYNKARSDNGSVWEYTAGIEAINAIMHALKTYKDAGNAALYDAHYVRYKTLLVKLYDNIDYYAGSFSLTSYTQTKTWNPVYAVDRAAGKGGANVQGVGNVYDDQQWLIRELLESYRITGDAVYLQKAEYLTEYVLDGMYYTTETNGGNAGGIPWGPGYTSKHTCSNGPFISPLAWLYDIYKDKADEITYIIIEGATSAGARVQRTEPKKNYYLRMAQMVYAWSNSYLLRSDGLYHDATWSDDNAGAVTYEDIDGVNYRKPSRCTRPGGSPLSYNAGSMLSGAIDLYAVTQQTSYRSEATALAQKAYTYFARADADRAGYDTWAIDGWNNWFNGVLCRAFVEGYALSHAMDTYAGSFQKNLDYAYDKYLYKGFLPTNLLLGWSSTATNNRVTSMFAFTYAAEYAVLAKHEMQKTQ